MTLVKYPTRSYKIHLITTHIMWYEIEMVDEYLTSLSQALLQAKWPIYLNFLINAQTYLETTDEEHSAIDLAEQIENKILNYAYPISNYEKSISVNIKTDAEPFYNIGDYRRETVNLNGGYTIWGETDSLYPTMYFKILEMISDEDDIKDPYVVSFASRKCWDETWTAVEHVHFQQLPPTQKGEKILKEPYNFDDYITQEQLNDFNKRYGSNTPPLVILNLWKFDGALLALHGAMPPLIPDTMHFAREDWCAQIVLEYFYPHIKQYHLPSILKGHNYCHPKKRMYTNSTRDDAVYKRTELESIMAARDWLTAMGLEFQPNGPKIMRSINMRTDANSSVRV